MKGIDSPSHNCATAMGHCRVGWIHPSRGRPFLQQTVMVPNTHTHTHVRPLSTPLFMPLCFFASFIIPSFYSSSSSSPPCCIRSSVDCLLAAVRLCSFFSCFSLFFQRYFCSYISPIRLPTTHFAFSSFHPRPLLLVLSHRHSLSTLSFFFPTLATLLIFFLLIHPKSARATTDLPSTSPPPFPPTSS